MPKDNGGKTAGPEKHDPRRARACPTPKFDMRARVRSGIVFFLAVLPALLGVLPVAYLRMAASHQAATDLKQELDAVVSSAPVPLSASERVAAMKERTKAIGNPDLRDCLDHYIDGPGLEPLIARATSLEATTRWGTWRIAGTDSVCLIAIVILGLLPFFSTAARQAYDAERDSKGSLVDHARPVALKFVVASAIAWGWVYTLAPWGMAATTVRGFVADSSALMQSSLAPLFQDGFTLRPVNAGFIGWYVFFSAYMFYRARRGDVHGLYVYGVVLRKLLVTATLAMVLSIDPKSVALGLTAFLVGVVPSAAIDVVKGYLAKDQGVRSSNALVDFLGLCPWDQMRLEEEGIDSLTALWMTDRAGLVASLPFSKSAVDQWYDIAALALAIGTDRYDRVRDVCRTGSGFLMEMSTRREAFVAKLAAANVQNADEIASLLQSRFEPPLQVAVASSV